MGLINSADRVIEVRARAAVIRHRDRIVAEFIEGAKRQGHDISPRKVTGVSLQRIHGVDFAVETFEIGGYSVDDAEAPVHLDAMSWNNNAPAPGHAAFEVSETTTDNYTWAMTSGVKAALKVSGSFAYRLPGGGTPITVDVSIDATPAATSGIASARARSWTSAFSREVPPYSHLTLDIYGRQAKGHAPYRITARASGRADIAIEFDYHGHRTHTATVELGQLLGPRAAQVEQAGIIAGLQGYKWHPVATERPLARQEMRRLPDGLHVDGLERTKLLLEA